MIAVDFCRIAAKIHRDHEKPGGEGGWVAVGG
jgi:hypothetical protein